MSITKVILIFLLILAIIILLNKKKIGEHLTQNEAMNNYLTAMKIEINTQLDKNLGNKIFKDKICSEQKQCISFQKMLLFDSPLNQYMYLPNTIDMSNNIIWQDLSGFTTKFRAIGDGISLDVRNNSKWQYKYIYGPTPHTSHTDGKGIEIDVPGFPMDYLDIDFTVLWVQLLGNGWNTFKVYAKNDDGTYNSFGSYAGGFNHLNNISPDGGIHNETWNIFEWYPVPIKLNKNRKIIISNPYGDFTESWFSGFAFSTNPWNHCKISAGTLHFDLNRDETNTTVNKDNIPWTHDNWNNEPLAHFPKNKNTTIVIPFVNSGRDKVFYIAEHNSNWGVGVTQITIINTNNKTEEPIQNLTTTFDNPFARHFNSKIYQRYYATIIPKEKISNNSKYLSITIHMPPTATDDIIQTFGELNFTEVGTHDVNPFDPVT